jgi:hypothetical protein
VERVRNFYHLISRLFLQQKRREAKVGDGGEASLVFGI